MFDRHSTLGQLVSSPDTSTDEGALRAALGARYALDRQLGRGGMATVYLARDLRHRRPVAVKVLHPELSAALGAERFLREIEVTASLQHPHILPLFESGEAAGLLYYVMPYVEGETLRARLAREGALPLADAVRLIRDLADALACAHGAGVMHRDLKPENVLLSGRHAVVADFGIAKALAVATQDGVAPTAGVTATGVAVGTPAYMAPEQAVGDAATDHRADLYALGVVAYEALAGAHPFGARSPPALVAAHLTEPPAPLDTRRPDVPPALSALVMRLLAKDPAARPQSADDVLRALDTAPTAPTAPSTSTPGASVGRRVMLVGASVLLLVVGVGGYAVWRRTAAPAGQREMAATAERADGVSGPVAIRRVAVLPFVNTGGAASGDDYFSDGLTDELIAALGKVAGLTVTGRTSAFALKGTRLSVRAIADTLRVEAMVTAAVRRAGSRLRVNATLVNAGDSVLWAGTYERGAEDVFAVQEEIARAIAAALHVTLVGGSQGALVRPGTADLAAYDQFLQAQVFSNQRTPAGVGRAVSYFKLAIARDPTFARAYAGLANAHLLMVVFANGRPSDQLPLARAAALRALELDSTLAEAHAALGHLLFTFDWQWADGLRALDRAITLDPGYSFARQLRGIYMMNQGRFAEAGTAFEEALTADPLSAAVRMNLGQMYLYSRQPDEAIRHLRDALELNPALRTAHQHLGFAFFQKRMPAEAVAAFERAAVSGSVRDSASLAYAYGAAGRRPEAEAIIANVVAGQRREYVPPFGMVLAYVALGDRDAAFAWLEQGYREHAAFMNNVKVLPALEPLHADPRWPALLRRMRLEP